MTSHRLMRCAMSDILAAAAQVHDRSLLDQPPVGRRAALWWRTWIPGSSVMWRLEVEQGANGILAHLTASPDHGPLRLLPLRVRRLALQPWTAHHLAALATAAEARPGPPS